jgi:hypothetical protein
VLGLLETGSGEGRTMTADKNLKNIGPPDPFDQMFAELRTPESKLRFEQSRRFLRRVIYAGLKDLNTGFDSPLICHFSPEDFLIVIDRCESLGVEVIGVEVFTTDAERPIRRGSKISKSHPYPGTTGRADWSGGT